MKDYKKLKEIAFEGNKKLGDSGLVLLTWGNEVPLTPKKRCLPLSPAALITKL